VVLIVVVVVIIIIIVKGMVVIVVVVVIPISVVVIGLGLHLDLGTDHPVFELGLELDLHVAGPELHFDLVVTVIIVFRLDTEAPGCFHFDEDQSTVFNSQPNCSGRSGIELYCPVR
jgi:hypothetical protein